MLKSQQFSLDLFCMFLQRSQFQEADIIDRLEKICDPDKEAGEWITMVDLQEEGDKLKVVDMGHVGLGCALMMLDTCGHVVHNPICVPLHVCDHRLAPAELSAELLHARVWM